MMKELKFIHITKCAGTFIEDIGNENGYKWGRFHEEYGNWHEEFMKKNKNLREKYDWFMVVRNPYTRILSEYYCKWGGIGECKIQHKTKEEFNTYLISKIQNMYNDKINRYQGHYYEQYKYIDRNVKTNIIKFEMLNEELKMLFDKYNININIDEYKEKKSNTKEKRFTEELKYSTYDFSPELIRLINKVYHYDFILFGYLKIEI